MDRILPAKPLLENLCELVILPYQRLDQVKDIYTAHCMLMDGIIFGGELAYLALQKELKERSTLPVDYLDVTIADFYKLMYNGIHRFDDLDSRRMAIDCMGEDNQFFDLHSVISADQFPQVPSESTDRASYEEMLQFHPDHYAADLDSNLMQLHQALLQFIKQKRLPLIVQKHPLHFELLTSYVELKGALTDNYRHCALHTYLNAELPFRVNIGWGVGHNVHRAKDHARSANKLASPQSTNGSFVMTEKEQIIGPLGDDRCLDLSNSPDPQVEKWSHALGISTLQIQKMLSVMTRLDNDELTTEDLSHYLAITERSANRILNELLEKGAATVTYTKQQKLRGRPKKMYKINFNTFSTTL